jgi:ABC-type metal ion transport system substrate-binding protein
MARKKGSGRTKGAGSFVKVSLQELNRLLRPEAVVIINRRYAELIGLANEDFIATTENIKAAGEQVDFQVTKLDSEEEAAPMAFKSEDW